ncbi:MAG: exodeoxyribonuclease VII large subunit [Candidatus Nanopelagicales bacterium]
MSFGSDPSSAVPVRDAVARLKDNLKKLPPIWVEGQLSEVKDRPGSPLIFASFRDLTTDVSVSTAATKSILGADSKFLVEGDRVLLQLQPEIWPRRGELQWRVLAIRPVGLGELLARLEALKQLLAAEGLFDPSTKKPLPFLPTKVGLICGRASAAMHDVMVNAKVRWPTVDFVVKEVAVQGDSAVKEVATALKELDANGEVDVIVIARGGGSLEDLLPFSDEGLIRLVAKMNTPIVSAIGHEQDTPLLDFVADYRASTPTDAARKIVPSLSEELEYISTLRYRLRREVRSLIQDEQAGLFELERSLLQLHPKTRLVTARQWIRNQQYLLRSTMTTLVANQKTEIAAAAATIRAMSPQGTLERGYAIVRTSENKLLTKPPKPGTSLNVRVAGGEFPAVTGERADQA